jgi:hypothetical protein
MMTARWGITNSALFRGGAAHFGKELRHKPLAERDAALRKATVLRCSRWSANLLHFSAKWLVRF